MQSAMSMGIQQTQNTLNQALSQQQTVAAELRDVQIQRAENTAAQAKRLADLIGFPPEDSKAPRTNEKQERTNKANSASAVPRPPKRPRELASTSHRRVLIMCFGSGPKIEKQAPANNVAWHVSAADA